MVNSENINIKDRDGMTPLMVAVSEDKIEIVKLLLKKGANINLQSKIGYTALHFAAQNNKVEIARVLLESGAKVDIQDGYGNTPLSRAIFSSDEEGEIIKLLLAFGSDENIKNKSGISPKILAESIGNRDVKKFFK